MHYDCNIHIHFHMCAAKDLCKNVYGALFILTPNRKALESPSMVGWINCQVRVLYSKENEAITAACYSVNAFHKHSSSKRGETQEKYISYDSRH